ncbi:hypothetical protein [Deinococcus aquatilis]
MIEACRKMGTAESTFFKWKNKFSGLGISDFAVRDSCKKKTAS